MTACRQLRLSGPTGGLPILRTGPRTGICRPLPAMNRLDPLKLLRLAGLAWMLAAGTLRAAEADPVPPPARVGQIAFISGSVRMQLEEAGTWQPAELNTPITAHGALATEPASRVELRIGSMALRAGVSAQFSLPELDDNAVAVEVARGSVAVRLRTLAEGERFALGAEGATLSALAPGAYRAEFAPRLHRLTVHVLEGQARVTVAQQVVVLLPNQRAVIDTQAQSVLEQVVGDERSRLDDFSDQRDRRSERSAALRHLPPEMTGAEALDGHGAWRNEAGYGMVWYPDALPPDWAPYRFGRWRWMPPWGWTWVDDAHWGFAPFHYGRWLFFAGRWGWVPGAPTLRPPGWRPVYAPALVGFYGGAEGWSPAAAPAPVVGWYPLAPGEVYWPAYSNRVAYVRGLNAGSVPDPGQIRAPPDANAPGPAHRFARTAFAVTAVPLASFREMQPVGPNQVGMAPAVLAQAPSPGRRLPPPPQAQGAGAPESGPHAAAPDASRRTEPTAPGHLAATKPKPPPGSGPGPHHAARKHRDKR